MKWKNFRDLLIKENANPDQIVSYVSKLKAYESFLNKHGKSLRDPDPDDLVTYSELLVSLDKESVLDFLRAIIYHANYTEKYDQITSVIDISESHNAMDNLYLRIGEVHGKNVRDEIFKNLTIPPLGVDPEKKPEFTKTIMKRMKNKLGENQTVDLLSPCLHGRPPDDITGDKQKLIELGIDRFLEEKHAQLVARLQKHKEEGTLEFAQYIDAQVVELIRNDQQFGHGIREGNTIRVKKIPYQFRKSLSSPTDNLKRFYACYCPWIRGAMKEEEVDESLRHFCHCSAGWYKLYWDQIFDHPIKAEPIKTALDGASECEIVLRVPEEILKPYLK